MRRQRSGESRPFESEAGILPMINVVFLLLVFFLLAGTVTTRDVVDLEPTASRSETDPGEQDFVILVGPDGALAHGGRVLEPAELRRRLEERMAAAPDAPVWIKADAGVDAVLVVDVLDAARDSGVDEARLLTTRGGR